MRATAFECLIHVFRNLTPPSVAPFVSCAARGVSDPEVEAALAAHRLLRIVVESGDAHWEGV